MPDLFIRRLVLFLIASLVVFDGIQLLGIPILNAFIILLFILSIIVFKVGLDHDLSLFVILHLLIFFIALTTSIIFGSDLYTDIRFIVTSLGLLMMSLLIYWYIRDINDLYFSLKIFSLSFFALSVLNILTTVGFIEPLSGQLTNNMNYIGDSLLGNVVIGKGQFLIMTNGNFTLLLVMYLSSIHTLFRVRSGFFSNYLCFSVLWFVAMIGAIFIQSRALFVSILLFYLILGLNAFAQSKYRRFAIFIFLTIFLAIFIALIPYIINTVFESSSGFSSRLAMIVSALELASENILFGNSISYQNDFALQKHGVPFHNYFLRYFSGLGFIGMMLIILTILIAFKKNIEISRFNHKGVFFCILSPAFYAMIFMINVYPAVSVKPMYFYFAVLFALSTMIKSEKLKLF